jgi:hypothetical protein
MTRIDAEVQNPDEMQIRVTLTMSLKEWQSVRDALKDETWWPCGRVGAAIAETLRKVTATVTEIVNVTP